jgi:hypothetical protein
MRSLCLENYCNRACFSAGGFPLEEASEHCSHFNKGIILVCYSLYFVVSLVISVIFLFLLNIT